MKTTKPLWLLCTLSAFAAPALSGEAPDPALPDTTQFKCKDCAFEQGWNGTVDLGIGNVSGKSAKFGEYNGLHKGGGFFIGDAALRFRGNEGYYWNLNAANLGLETRSLDGEGGRQGRYKMFFRYDETAHFISDSVQSPFQGIGGANLTLPAGFPAATTGAMPLGATLQTHDIGTQRMNLALGATWQRTSEWAYTLKVSHDTREGTKRIAGSFYSTSAQLVEHVDYATDQLELSAAHTGRKLQVKLGYYLSSFRNDHSALTWQNPFTAAPVAAGALTGQLAMPPSNDFHQFLASAGYSFSPRTRLSADIAWGRMTQNESYLPSTTNAALAVPALPSGSLNGKAETFNAGLKLTSALTDRLRLNASYTRDERDNQTPQALYPSVATDMFLNRARLNLPYSFNNERLRLSAEYRFGAATRAAVGYDYDSRKRTFQEVDRTKEDTVWGKLSTRAGDKLSLSAKLAHGERKTSGYQVVPGIDPPENPLLRKYNMAARDRDSGSLRADIAATDKINIGLGAESSRDDYTESAIGLVSGRDQSVNGDLSVVVGEGTTLTLFAVRQEIKSRQRGSQTFSVADWTGENRDRVDTLGLGLRHAAIKDKLDIGADYTMSRARTEIKVLTSAAGGGFPDLTSNLDSVRVYANYRIKDNLSLLGSLQHERLDTQNWMQEGVGPSTIPNVLTLGEFPFRYHINVVRLALRYRL